MNFHDLGATGIIGAVVLALAVIGFLKGLIRTVLAMICLGIAGYTALWGHEHASDLTGPWISNPGPWVPKIIAVLTGLAVFFVCRYLLNFVIDPFNRSKTGKRIGFGLPAAALSLCSGLLILWLAFAGIRYGGSLAEIRQIQYRVLSEKKLTPESLSYTTPLLLKAKHALDASSVGQWHRRTDPFHVQGRVTLCKVLILYHNSQIRMAMLKNARFNALLNHPDFLKTAYQKSLANLVASGNPRALLTAPAVRVAASSQDLIALLQQISDADISHFASH